jgi:hypothetical protein
MADNPLFLSTHDVAPSAKGASPDTGGAGIGDLRRRYAFGDRVSELAIDQTPFFRFLSMASKKPTDDPEFKSLEQRHSFHKRYAYVVGLDLDGGTIGSGDNDNEYVDYSFAAGDLAAGQTMNVKLQADYLSEGNVQSVLGQTGITIGDTGTQPQCFLVGQMIKIPVRIILTASLGAGQDDMSPGNAGDIAVDSQDYLICQITNIGVVDTGADAEAIYAEVKVVRPAVAVASSYYMLPGAEFDNAGSTFDGIDLAGAGEADKCYVVGNAHAEGSGFPDSWKDQPYRDVFGFTQIFKTSCQMTNTARATQLKLVPDEWARIWKQKLIEHKYDMEQAFLFNRKLSDSTTRYTQGIVDYILQSGNIFGLDTATKSQDSFLDDMSDYLDPRYNNGAATVFFASTEIYNWLHKLSGYFANNVGMVKPGASSPDSSGASYGRADMSITGKKKVFGLNVTTISTPYGDMNVTRNIHLDSGAAGAKMVGVNMKHVAYRPLVGNGVNRDTSIYVGVQSLENTGVDRRIDLIQTEAGLECLMPEAHAVWK